MPNYERWLPDSSAFGVVTFNLHGVSNLTLPLLLYGFRKENNRTLAALKRYVEAQAPG